MTSVAHCFQGKSILSPNEATLSYGVVSYIDALYLQYAQGKRHDFCSLRLLPIALNVSGIETIILKLFLNGHVFLPNSKNFKY